MSTDAQERALKNSTIEKLASELKEQGVKTEPVVIHVLKQLGEGGFGKVFRRSNLLTQLDAFDVSVISSRMDDIKVQMRRIIDTNNNNVPKILTIRIFLNKLILQLLVPKILYVS